MAAQQFDVGDEVKDMVTGYQGIVTIYSRCLTGCDRVLIQAPVDKQGNVPDAIGCDVTVLKMVKRGKVTPTGEEKAEMPRKAGNGGPMTRGRII